MLYSFPFYTKHGYFIIQMCVAISDVVETFKSETETETCPSETETYLAETETKPSETETCRIRD